MPRFLHLNLEFFSPLPTHFSRFKNVTSLVGSFWQLQIFLSLSESPEHSVSSLEPLADCLEICCLPVSLIALWTLQGDTVYSA